MSAVRFNTPGRTARIIFDGQSLNVIPGISGTTTTELPQQVRAFYNNIPVSNVSVNGQSWISLASTFTTREPTVNFGTSGPVDLNHFVGIDDKTIVVFNGGTAGILADRTGAQLNGDHETYADLWLAAGVPKSNMLVMTLPGNVTNTSGQNTQRLAYNTLLVANTYGWGAVVDIGGTTATPEPAHGLWDWTDATYYDVDQVHWNAAGAAYAATLIKPSLDTILAA